MGFADDCPAMSIPRQSCLVPLSLSLYDVPAMSCMSVMTVAAVERYGPLEEAVTAGLTWVSLSGPAMSCL